MNVYLDTNLWNALCDQDIDPKSLSSSLSYRKVNLVLGINCVYEMSKTFHTADATGTNRGKKLFSYLKKILDINTLCAKSPMELLAEEMLALKWQVADINPFLREDDYRKIDEEVTKLANGIFDEGAGSFIKQRVSLASATRSGQAAHLQQRPNIRQQLRAVTESQFPTWLQSQINTQTGIEQLSGHIQRQYPDAPLVETKEWAEALLGSVNFRMARGLVSADIYYNWRCAHRDSNPKDLVDDMFHVLNAIYCDVYATKECGQSQYAKHLLASGTKVAIYDGKMRIDKWLVALN